MIHASKTNAKLDAIIKDSPINQTEMAKMLGYSRQYLFYIRQDPSLMSLQQVEKLAKVLQVDFKVIQAIHAEARENKKA